MLRSGHPSSSSRSSRWSRLASLVAACAIAATPAILVAPASASADATAEQAAKTAEVVNKVQSFYEKTTSFKSPFTQEFTATLHNKKTASKGTVVFSKPGKMSWEYAEPSGNRVVSDGQKLRVYEAANKQMYEQVVDKSQYPAALSFLTGQGKLTDSFTFDLYEGEKMSFPGGYVLVGTPKQPTPAYKKVLFYVDKATSQVRRVIIIDGQGNKNRFDFLSPKINEVVPPTQFQFTPPAGTNIIKP